MRGRVVGDLRALVATASLELGIDVGPVELVCQIGSPHSIATFLQRVGRANHHRTGVPRGVMYPTTRDELVECAALLAAVERGRLDALHPPEQPLDILAQQIVAETAARGDDGVAEDELFDLVTRAWPYRQINREEFGITWNAALETGGWVVGKTVRLELEAEAVQKG